MILSNRVLLVLAALNGLGAVAFGAFAAHGLADPHAKELVRTGAAYELAHAIAAIAVLDRIRLAALLMGLGGLVFSASLYALALGAPGVVGAVTPLGGALMLAGWAALLATALRSSGAVPPEGS